MPEVLRGARHNICKQFHHNAACRLASDADIKEHLWICHGRRMMVREATLMCVIFEEKRLRRGGEKTENKERKRNEKKSKTV